MPKVIKHTTNNLVTVSYPMREAVLDITHAEHALILAFSTQKVQMIKFIRNQYNIGLYEAKQVVDTVLNSAEQVLASEQVLTSELPVDGWDAVTPGTMIYVRDCDDHEWVHRVFVSYSSVDYGLGRFTCRHSYDDYDDTQSVNWKFAKLIIG